MRYECKQCGAGFFVEYLGPVSCRECGSKDLWITGGLVRSLVTWLLVLLVIALAIVVAAYAAQSFGGYWAAASVGILIVAVGGLVVGVSFAIWSVFRARKSIRDYHEHKE